MKRLAATALVLLPAAALADDGMALGIGTGATAGGVILALISLLGVVLRRQGEAKSEVSRNTDLTEKAARRTLHVVKKIDKLTDAVAQLTTSHIETRAETKADLKMLGDRVGSMDKESIEVRTRLGEVERQIAKLITMEEMRRSVEGDGPLRNRRANEARR